jgi:ABC-type phosphate/phosphonate transport system permease subunit
MTQRPLYTEPPRKRAWIEIIIVTIVLALIVWL